MDLESERRGDGRTPIRKSGSGGAPDGSGWRDEVSSFCGRLIEAVWLVAVAVVPVAYDPHAALGFDPFKMVLLRSLGAVVIVALVVRFFAGWRPSGARSAWLLAVGLLVGSSVVASLGSIDPMRSWLGSIQFLQGTWSLVCGLGLFVGVATHLRTVEQRDRLIAVLLAASVPVTLGAMLQRAGFDPLGFNQSDGAVFSFGGHPIYLAGYLAMLIPLGVWRFWSTRRDRRAALVAWGCVVGLLVAAVFATEKRGVVVALVVGSAAGLFLIAAVSRRWRLVLGGIGLAGGVAGLFLILAILMKMDLPVKEVPVINRLSMIVPIGEGTGDYFRDSLWGEAAAILLGERTLVYPDGAGDNLRSLRPWIGYGPETLQGMLPQFWLFQLGGPQIRFESRFHNGFWDVWQSVGWLGLAACGFFLVAVFESGIRSLRLVPATRSIVRPLVWGVAGVVIGGGAMTLIAGPGYLGMGVPLGLLAGLLAGSLGTSWKIGGSGVVEVNDGAGLTIALLVAVVIHWVDLVFAFSTGQTLAIFWILSGALVAGRCLGEKTKNEEVVEGSDVASARAGVLTGLILIVMTNAFLNVRSLEPLGGWGVFTGAFAGTKVVGLALLGMTWMAVNGLILFGSGPVFDWRRALRRAGGISLLMAVAFGVAKSFWIAKVGPFPSVDGPADSAVSQALQLGWIAPTVLAVCLIGVVGVALVGAKQRMVICGAGACLGVAVIWLVGIGVLREGAASRWGDLLYQIGRPEQAGAVFGAALEFDPANVPNRMMRANALMDSAEAGAGDFSAKMGEAADVLEAGRNFVRLSPLDHHLGRAYLRWGLGEGEGAGREVLGGRAREAIERALRFQPGSETLWFEASVVDREFFDQSSADEKLERANRSTARREPPEPSIDPTSWGDFYASLSRGSQSTVLREAYGRRGLAYFSRGLGEDADALKEGRLSADEIADLPMDHYQTRLTMGMLWRNLGEPARAVKEFELAAVIPIEGGNWEAEGRAAEDLAAQGDSAAALIHIERALDTAPEAVRDDLRKLREHLQK